MTSSTTTTEQIDGRSPHVLKTNPGAVPPRLRRRPMLMVMAAALAAVGGVLGMVLWSSATSTVEVVIVRSDVPRGEVIDAADVGVARVVADPAMRTVPGGELAHLLGRRAAVDLTAGTLLPPGVLTDALDPGAGQAMVGVPIQPGLMPAEPLRAGDRVLLVYAPTATGQSPGKAAPVPAVVVRVTPGNTQMVVDVLVPTSVAPDLAGRILTGKLGLILDSRVR